MVFYRCPLNPFSEQNALVVGRFSLQYLRVFREPCMMKSVQPCKKCIDKRSMKREEKDYR